MLPEVNLHTSMMETAIMLAEQWMEIQILITLTPVHLLILEMIQCLPGGMWTWEECMKYTMSQSTTQTKNQVSGLCGMWI